MADDPHNPWLTRWHAEGPDGRWLIDPRTFDPLGVWDPKGLRRWTRLLKLAAGYRTPQDAAAALPEGKPAPFLVNRVTGEEKLL